MRSFRLHIERLHCLNRILEATPRRSSVRLRTMVGTPLLGMLRSFTTMVWLANTWGRITLLLLGRSSRCSQRSLAAGRLVSLCRRSLRKRGARRCCLIARVPSRRLRGLTLSWPWRWTRGNLCWLTGTIATRCRGCYPCWVVSGCAITDTSIPSQLLLCDGSTLLWKRCIVRFRFLTISVGLLACALTLLFLLFFYFRRFFLHGTTHTVIDCQLREPILHSGRILLLIKRPRRSRRLPLIADRGSGLGSRRGATLAI